MKFIKLISIVVAFILALGCVTVGAESFSVPEVLLFGDVDMDGVVTVKDATAIQKGIAELTYLTSVQRFLCDPDKTGVSVKNATGIQKCVADLDCELCFGEELAMDFYDKFSCEVNIGSTKYYTDAIVVVAKPGLELMLEDFPEFDFTSIERIGGLSDVTKPAQYLLYLENPSYDNVYQAIKTLDYRANIDLERVFVNSYTLPN